MKAIYTFILLLVACTLSINAQKVVALHSNANGVQYFEGTSAFEDAYAAAVATDTIYLAGGTFTPPSLFDKQLTIFGAGHHPDATTATMPTTISTHVTLGENADGFYLEGVSVNGNINLGNVADTSVNDVIIKRCMFNNLYAQGTSDTNTCNNNLFTENIIDRLSDVNNLRSSSFYNNIIQNNSGSFRELLFLNNVFNYQAPNGGNSYDVMDYADNCIFKNNIFLNIHAYLCRGDGQSEWVNNIFCNPNPTLGLNPILTNNYHMDRANVLVNQSGNNFDYAHDYHLQPGAAANLGDDGTETGIYGGVFVWKDYSIPTNPHIVSKTISGSSDTSGNIQVNIVVEAQDN